MTLKNGSVFASIKNTKSIYLVYTFLIFLYNFCYGNLSGATMVDLAKVYEVSIGTISQLNILSSIGFIVGSLAGWLYKWLPRQLLMALFTLLASVCNTFVPFYRPFWVACLTTTLIGSGLGVYMAGYNTWLAEMHLESSSAVMLAAQFAYGLGMAISPLLASKFVYGEVDVTPNNETLTIQMRQKSIAVPYIYTGIAQAISPVILIILFFVYRYQAPDTDQLKPKATSDKPKLDPETKIDPDSPKTISEQKASQCTCRVAKLILCAICLSVYTATELAYIPYCATLWQEMPIRLSAAEAARLSSAHSAAYTIAPLITSFLSLKLQPDWIISCHYVILTAGISILYFGSMNTMLIYVENVVLGYGMSPMSPLIYSFVNRHFQLTNRVASSFSFATAICSLIVPFILSRYIESIPLILIYLIICFILVSSAVYAIIKLWITISK